MNMTQNIKVLCVLLAAFFGMYGHAKVHPEIISYGVIEQVDLNRQSIIVNGLRYTAPATVQVSIGGSYGAFTMLRPGMNIRYGYQNLSAVERLLTVVTEVTNTRQIKRF